MTLRAVFILMASGAIVCAGTLHGVWTNRWGSSAELRALAARVSSVPMNFGEWEGTDDPRSEREWSAAGAVGHLSRTYRREGDGAQVVVMVVGGLPARIASHSPEACYPGGGYTIEGRHKERLSQDTKADVFVATARKAEPEVGRSLRVYWAWNSRAGWQAPDDGRIVYVAEPVLVKVYVVLEDDGTENTDRTARSFLNEYLPLLQENLFPGAVLSNTSKVR